MGIDRPISLPAINGDHSAQNGEQGTNHTMQQAARDFRSHLKQNGGDGVYGYGVVRLAPAWRAQKKRKSLGQWRESCGLTYGELSEWR